MELKEIIMHRDGLRKRKKIKNLKDTGWKGGNYYVLEVLPFLRQNK